jgi:hypothetical protein
MIVVISIIVLAVWLSSYVIQLESRKKSRAQLKAEIINLIVEYKNGETETIDLSEITSITWDRFYIFGPYIPHENIEKRLGAPFRPDRRMAPPRIFEYLVFTLDGEVVQYVDWTADVEWNADHFVTFSGRESLHGKDEGYKRDEALFVISEYGTVLWVYEGRLQTK